MPYAKPQLSDEQVRTLLSERFVAPQGELRAVEGGQIAQAIAFTASGQAYIIRINPATVPNFEKDVYVYHHYATPHVPIPPIYQLGTLGELSYAISPLMPGQNMTGLSPEETASYLPTLIATLDAIHASDVSDSRGYGAFDAQGIAPYPTWRAFITSIGDEHPPGSFYGNWHSLFAETFLEREVWERVHAAMLRLLDYCPEQRWLLHADYAFGNVLVQDGRITAVLDWANAMYGDFLFDIAWLDYGLPNHQILDRYAAYVAAQGRTIAHYQERLRCYRYLIALDSMRFYAKVGKEDEYMAIKAQILPTLLFPLSRAKLPVACVTEAGDDIAVFVEVAVYSGDVDGYVRVGSGEVAHTFGGGNQTHELDASRSPAFEDVNRGDSRAAGCQHRVEDEAHTGGRLHRQFVVVFDWFEGGVVAVEADVPHLCIGDHRQHRVYHAQPGAEDWHEADALGNLLTYGGGHRRFYVDVVGRQVGGGFVGEQYRNLAHQFAELLRLSSVRPQQRQLVAYQRMVGDVQVRHSADVGAARGFGGDADSAVVAHAASCSLLKSKLRTNKISSSRSNTISFPSISK